MMPHGEEEIKKAIKDYIAEPGESYPEWYVGVTKDPGDRLFSGHGVDEKKGRWIWQQAHSSAAARRVEAYFLNTLRTDGGTGGGDEDAEYVYAYEKAAHTRP